MTGKGPLAQNLSPGVISVYTPGKVILIIPKLDVIARFTGIDERLSATVGF